MSLGTKMAIAAATGSTLNQIGNDDEDVKDEDTGPGMKSYGIHGLSIVGFGSAIASMFMISGIWVGFTSLFTIALSPLAVWQRVQLDSLGGMRGQQNALRQKVNNLTSENNKLTSSIDDFEQQVENLKHVEGELDGITSTAGGQVDRIVTIVRENGVLQKEIKEMLDDEVLQQILTTILNSDRDGDYTLSKLERRQLEYKLRNLPGVIFHKDRFNHYCDNDHGDLTIADVTKIAHNIKDPNIPNNQRIFEYETKDLPHKAHGGKNNNKAGKR